MLVSGRFSPKSILGFLTNRTIMASSVAARVSDYSLEAGGGVQPSYRVDGPFAACKQGRGECLDARSLSVPLLAPFSLIRAGLHFHSKRQEAGGDV